MSEIDDLLVEHLRERHMANNSPADLARWICEQVGLDAPSRPVVFGYFSRAFGLRLADLMQELGAWVGFDPSGRLADEEFDRAVGGLVAGER